MNSDIVILDVGGVTFKTTWATLIKASYFKHSKKFAIKGKVIFIDRDPDNFKHVLSLLRDPNYLFPDEIKYELEFYGINRCYMNLSSDNTNGCVLQ